MARNVMGRDLYYTAAYWVDGLLIDTGCAHTADEFVSAVQPFPVKLIVNTHSHEDHIGANRSLQAKVGDHICLYEPEQGWLFCGDAYVGGRDRALRADYNIWQILASLKRMAGLNVTCIFPGSGRVREGALRLLAEKIRHLERTGERVLALSNRGWNYKRIRKEVLGKEMLIAYLTLGHFSGRNLVRSFYDGGRESDSGGCGFCCLASAACGFTAFQKVIIDECLLPAIALRYPSS